MRSKLLPENECRDRIQRLFDVLRAFGLVDRFGLSELMWGGELPKKDAICKAIRLSGQKLPNSISPEYIADCLIAALSKPSVVTQAWNVAYQHVNPELQSISTGRSAARKYHRHIFDLLTAVFDGILSNGRIEQEINDGRGRIDIAFDNTATHGFFQEIQSGASVRIPSVVVPIECKNYEFELSNSEFDQLSGRLNVHRGMLGLLFCRTTNKRNATLHCKDRFSQKREAILVLDDLDANALFEFRRTGNLEAVDDVFRNKLRDLYL